MHVNGSCHCGAIRFTAEVDAARVLVCHCTDCQVLTGSAFRVFVPAPIESFALHGEPTRYVKVAESGARRVQAFCPQCGTPVFSTVPEGATQIMLRVGTLSQRTVLLPSLQIWKRSSLPWVESLHAVQGCLAQEALSTQ
jgi:hypothetical protein